MALAQQCQAQSGEDGLLSLAIDCARDQGLKDLECELLRRQRGLRETMQMADARRRAQVMAVRLETERAMAEAARERSRALDLEQANATLSQQAEKLRSEAQHDHLTGLANRRLLESQLRFAFRRARLSALPLMIAALDVDHFKRVNDTHGHAAGDQVLVRLAQVLTAHSRADDVVARVGGEEFVVVFHAASRAQAAEAAERLRHAVASTEWEDVAPGLPVTISAGLTDATQWPGVQEALAAADHLLYAAKAAGRNRVIS